MISARVARGRRAWLVVVCRRSYRTTRAAQLAADPAVGTEPIPGERGMLPQACRRQTLRYMIDISLRDANFLLNRSIMIVEGYEFILFESHRNQNTHVCSVDAPSYIRFKSDVQIFRHIFRFA